MTDDAWTSGSFLRLLRECRDPLKVNAELLLVLHKLSAPTKDFVSLTPAILKQLLHIVVERTEDTWLEVRKKIAFLFSDLLAKDNGDVLADALLYGRLHTTTSSETRASHIDFGDVDDGECDINVAVRSMEKILVRLAEAHSTVERCVPSADVFRCFMSLPPLLEIILSPVELLSKKGLERPPLENEGASAQVQQKKQHRFEETCIGILCRGTMAHRTTLCTQTWRSLTVAIETNKSLSASLLIHFFDDFVSVFLNALRGNNFVAKLHALELLAAILEDPSYLRARAKFAESPALLCALILLTNTPSQHIRFLTFDSLKVFIAKGNKPAPIRYILYINREMLARYVKDFITEEAFINQLLSVEKQKLLHSLISLQPLTHEEELLLRLL
ncbi:hypothetical protein TRVL_00712 [Trypanosoma vivax]|nr:hypothetical protein TRVL_00712 [Trypanosoma vivax]